MRIIFFACYIFISFDIFSQSNVERNCLPTTSIKGVLCPDSVYCPCPPNARCGRRVIASDKNLTVVGFKVIFNGLKEQEEDNIVTESNSDIFSPHMLALIIKTQKGSRMEFVCIKAKNSKGQIFILQPFTMNVRGE